MLRSLLGHPTPFVPPRRFYYWSLRSRNLCRETVPLFFAHCFAVLFVVLVLFLSYA